MGLGEGFEKKAPPGCALTGARVFYYGIVFVLGALMVWLATEALLVGTSTLSPEALNTRALVDGLSKAIEEYSCRSVRGEESVGPVGMVVGRAMNMYLSGFRDSCPPDRAVGVHPDLDKPAECLVYYLTAAFTAFDAEKAPARTPWRHTLFQHSMAGRGFYPFRQDELTDSDGDGLPEVSDAWGRPIRYNSGPEQNGPFNQNGAPRHNRLGFDLWSAGPDGIDGTPDDITNWR